MPADVYRDPWDYTGAHVLDTWSALTFKHAFPGDVGAQHLVPTWVGDHGRRLAAYRLLASYLENRSRDYLFDTVSQPDAGRDYREYGDPTLIRDAILSALLGDGQEVHTDGAEVPVGDTQANPGSAPADPAQPEAGETPEQAQARQQQQSAEQLQNWLRDWFDDERGRLKVYEVERDAVGLGDGVYTLGWDPVKQRTRLRVWDPGFYFPVLPDGNDDDFPDRVHVAWEFIEKQADGTRKRKVRRLTWEVRPIEPVDEPGALKALFGAEPTLAYGDRTVTDEFGRAWIERDVPWSDSPVRHTCYYSDGTWTLDATDRSAVAYVDALAPELGVYEVENADLRIDFLPVVHIPNTVAVKEHYGRSSLSHVAQIFDDLNNTATDLQAAGATAAKPTVAVEGRVDQDELVWRPGAVWTGKVTAVDTSRSLDALLKLSESLQEKLERNSHLPAAHLGRISPAQVPSGLALALSYGPLASLIGAMRLARDEKYPILLKFAWRMTVAGDPKNLTGWPTEWHRSTVEFGSYLPQDKAAAVSHVTGLLQAKAISWETGVRILMDAGFPIEDAAAEVERIESRDFDGADKLLSATAAEKVVYAYLGLDESQIPPPAPAPGTMPGVPTPGQTAADRLTQALQDAQQAGQQPPAPGQPPVTPPKG